MLFFDFNFVLDKADVIDPVKLHSLFYDGEATHIITILIVTAKEAIMTFSLHLVSVILGGIIKRAFLFVNTWWARRPISADYRLIHLSFNNERQVGVFFHSDAFDLNMELAICLNLSWVDHNLNASSTGVRRLLLGK